jgi:hypothetical protein
VARLGRRPSELAAARHRGPRLLLARVAAPEAVDLPVGVELAHGARHTASAELFASGCDGSVVIGPCECER